LLTFSKNRKCYFSHCLRQRLILCQEFLLQLSVREKDLPVPGADGSILQRRSWDEGGALAGRSSRRSVRFCGQQHDQSGNFRRFFWQSRLSWIFDHSWIIFLVGVFTYVTNILFLSLSDFVTLDNSQRLANKNDYDTYSLPNMSSYVISWIELNYFCSCFPWNVFDKRRWIENRNSKKFIDEHL